MSSASNPSHKPRRGDFSQVARQIVREATEPHDEVRAADEAYASALRDDPSTADWISEARRSLTDGTFDKEVREQPDPVQAAEILRSRRC